MIDQSLIKSISKSLKRGKSVNRNLPYEGKIVIDQLLPYLCVYRYPEEGKDQYLAGLLRTQAAYILVRRDIDISKLLCSVASSISAQYKAVLIIEMWPRQDRIHEIFKVLSPKEKAPATTNALKEGLEGIRFDYPQVIVEVHDTKERHPQGVAPLLSIEQFKEIGGLVIGIEIPTIYHDADKEHFALLYRKLRSRISRVLKKTAFEFIRVQASNEFTHYLMLGKTRLTKLVRSADRRIAEVSERMNFLMRVTPVNDASAWEQFQEDKFKKVPSFNYRLIPLDPELEKRKLYDIKLEQIDDPTLTLLLRNKRKELELQLTMLEARQKKAFRHLSQSLFGEVPQSTKQLAQTILKETSPDDTREKVPMNSEEFAALARDEVEIYARQFPELKIGVEIRHDISGLMVSKSNLLVSDAFEIDAFRAQALIQHEVGTHILTYCNGRRQPLQQMYAGLDGYDQLQEGLAVLNEYLAGGLTAGRLRLLAARVVAADMMVKDSGFIETFNYLREELKFTKHTAFDITTRIFRGGGFTKDSVYLRGLEQLMEFLKKGGRLKTLYIGKFDLKHVDLIEELVHRNVLNEPFLPPMLEKKSVKERVNKVCKGLTPLELLTDSITKNEYESSIYN
ncbi:flavohemoglobin expression-modulating QEGLA motif protein [Fulvivirga ulvae]|uniref:flavohemoglobin expression-modulating QEGLA motif protein n=1 Tax=Fulvivirga ulvae TaxID=2904245 RepID=UPI001F1E0EB5|nr:tyrosine/phenylalanine carboxypeptidase domain-containing protein [Fulvivirga ulvae]UII30995.1 flavohemoglobin expression-modulating QEGLA motif protein [Fulvivirga ulvae]